MPSRHPDRSTVSELAESLRDEAIDLAQDMPGVPPHGTFGAEAAQTLEEFEAALTRIANGVPDPHEIARAALTLAEPLKPLGDDAPDAPLDPDAVIRAMLKPRPI